MGITGYLLTVLRHAAGVIGLAAMIAVAHATGPVETSIFAVQGVEVDVTDISATVAKDKALLEVQMKAFRKLAENIGSPEIVETIATYEPAQVVPYLKSLSIEEESISPGRYKGKLTVRFLPEKIKALYTSFGVRIVSQQGPSFLVLPVWKTADGKSQLWEENPWRAAWIALRAEQSVLPVIVPLGDLDDSEIISAEDVLGGDEVKLEALRRRYDVNAVLVAYAEAEDGGAVHARMEGDSPLGKVTFDKTYAVESGNLEEAATLAVTRFHGVMVDKYRSGANKSGNAASRRVSINVSVPFAGPSEWNRLRSRILSAPGVVGLDVSSLGGDGAVIRLTISGEVEEMEARFARVGLQLSRAGGGWVIQQL